MRRKYICSITFLFLFTFAFSVISTFAQTKKVRPRMQFRTRNFSYKIYNEDFVNTPKWNAEEGEPPVTISRATQIARANLSRFVDSSEKFKVRSIRLHEAGSSGDWLYWIHFYCSSKECRGLDLRSFVMLIKMNESVIEPKKLPPDF